MKPALVLAAILASGTAIAGASLYAARPEAPAAAVASPAPKTVAAVEPAGATHPVAVELFTSQGCSSCPPADAVIERLSGRPDVVAITRPVTYWDRLGWKDTLAREANTQLQRAYSQRRIPGAGVYTPQTVIQGRLGFVGGREDLIRPAIGEAGREPEAAIAIAGTGATRVVTLSGQADVQAQVLVVALRSSVEVPIGAGENGGRTVRYTNVVVDERAVGSWRGGAARIAIPQAATSVAGADRYAVLVRQGTAGPILAARYL